MIKVSGLWRMFAMFALGMTFGIFVSIKYIAPPSQDIKIGRISIKAKKNSTVTDAVDITKIDTQDEPEESRRDKRKAARQERRNK
jgi:hypothetical protein